VTLFITLYFATRTETVIHVNAGTALVAQSLSENVSSASPSLSSLRAPQVEPQFRTNVAMNGLLLSLLGYLVAYTAVGLYVLIRTSPRQMKWRALKR